MSSTEQRYSVAGRWKLIAGKTDNLSQVVVIPAYAEKNLLFSTLDSLARNAPASLDYSFVLCVINCKEDSPPEVRNNNQLTLDYLQALVSKKGLGHLQLDRDLKDILQLIADSGLRLGYVDASTAGSAIPAKEGGVGMARKLGMDMALSMLSKSPSPRKIICNLDADTLVQSNYLATVKDSFTGKVKAAVVAYEHQEPLIDEEKAAIYCYEIFLRYWILGLKYARSPYAFHSIGSTMICSTDAYLDVRGMNRREAGEDFYFLNKLKKIGDISYIKNTCVFPSARASQRVPFGTGKRIQRFLNHEQEEYLLYDPQIFEILARWLRVMEKSFHYNEDDIMARAVLIHPLLTSFLTDCRFLQSWKNIRRNVKNGDALRYQLHCWFDGFQTLKLINYLSREVYPPVNMFTALRRIMQMQEMTAPDCVSAADHPELDRQKKIVQYLRQIT